MSDKIKLLHLATIIAVKHLLTPGIYVVAVSGGIDSVALLHMLQAETGTTLIVTHFDHGIRADSAEDADFVRALAESYNLQYVSKRVELGKSASENTARTHRYQFLRDIAETYQANAILTAHHLDDRIETAAINVLRGTMRRGIVSLQSTPQLQRPLLHMTKEQIREYVLLYKLEFREDSTNSSMDYLRNRVRARLYKKLTPEARTRLIELFETIEGDNSAIDELVSGYLTDKKERLLRSDFIEIDAPVLFEIIAEWLRRHSAVFDKNTIVRICNGARTLQNGAKIDIDKHHYCQLSRTEIILTER